MQCQQGLPRRQRRCPIFDKLVDVLLQFIHLFQVYHYVHAYERGVVLRFGRYHRNAEPGCVWVWPMGLEQVLTTNVKPEPLMVGPQSLTTVDGKQVAISAMFIVTVEDPKKFLLEMEGGFAALVMIAYGAVARMVESMRLEDLKCADAEEITTTRSPSRELAKIMRRKVKEFGAGVHDAQITEMCETKSLRLLTAQKPPDHLV